MADMGAISGIAASLNAAVNITKAMKDLRDWSLVQSKVIELQGIILEAQSSLFTANEERATLVERISQLEKQVAEKEAWNTTKERYESVDVGGGVVAYTQKAAVRGAEAAHYICANCYHNDKISILSHVRASGTMHILNCPTCKAANVIRHGYRAPR